MSILDTINSSSDIKKLNKTELTALCDELRRFEIESIDYERVLSLYDTVGDDADCFFEELPGKFQGEWKSCGSEDESFGDYVEEYFNADFIFGRDGDSKAELDFIVNWARARQAQVLGEVSV